MDEYDAAPMLHLDGFDGPLDLLLDLAGRARIDLGRIDLGALIDQLVAAFARAGTPVPVVRRADWLVLAARLLLLRARLLFAPAPGAAEQAGRAAARDRARRHDRQAMTAATAWLDARPLLGWDVFARPRRGRDPRVASYMRLMEACLAVLRGRAGEDGSDAPAYRPPIPGLFRAPAAIARLRRLLGEAEGTAALAAFLPTLPDDARSTPLIARSALAATFVAALELARTEEAVLAQERPFGTIGIAPARRRQDRGAGRAQEYPLISRGKSRGAGG